MYGVAMFPSYLCGACVQGVTTVADPVVRLKRKASVVVDAPALHTALKQRLALPTDLGLAKHGPRKSSNLLCLQEGVLLVLDLVNLIVSGTCRWQRRVAEHCQNGCNCWQLSAQPQGTQQRGQSVHKICIPSEAVRFATDN